MSANISPEEQVNYETWRECVSEPLIRRLAVRPEKVPKKRAVRKGQNVSGKVVSRARRPKRERVKETLHEDSNDESPVNDAEELGEFIDYIAAEIFTSLPDELRALSYSAIQNDPSLEERYASPLSQSTLDAILAPFPPTITDSLVAYDLIERGSVDGTAENLAPFLGPILSSYISSMTAPPPMWSTTRASACEICERTWIPLTYHHLIPRSTHAKVLKRGWHEEWELNRVAWLCRACHSFVHGMESNEELARAWHTVDLLRGREDVQRWAEWVGRVRWKAR